MQSHIDTIHESLFSGKFKITNYINSKKVEIQFLETGYNVTTRMEHIRSGEIKDWMRPRLYGIGFYGANPRRGAKYTNPNAYEIWTCMLQRVYDTEEHKKSYRACYIGCSVDPEWHNFQNFAKFYDENYPKDALPGEYHLDKDIKYNGNKVYSPENCQFVLAKENLSATNLSKKLNK